MRPAVIIDSWIISMAKAGEETGEKEACLPICVIWRTIRTHPSIEVATYWLHEKKPTSLKDLPFMRPTLFLAEEMGARLGSRHLLLEALQPGR